MLTSEKELISLVWLKRDLRFHDHAPFATAAKDCEQGGKALAFYVIETDYWATDKASSMQLDFIIESLAELKRSLHAVGCSLLIFQAPSAEEIIELLLKTYRVEKIFCHQETGNLWTFERDKKVHLLARQQKIPLVEFLQNGVARGQLGRSSEGRFHGPRWWQWAESPLAESPRFWRDPAYLPPELPTTSSSSISTAFISSTGIYLRQLGGESLGRALLSSFLSERSLAAGGYRKEMSSPLHAAEICSRISAHLTWGTLSTKTAVQVTLGAIRTSDTSARKNQLQSFVTRLRWRDHFLQKFERLYWMEAKCINPAAETLHGWNEEFYTRWAHGMTGYPFIDACMRSLNSGKWINFRARAMLVSFASYALNLDWRGFGPHLARTFLDYEPGIHYSQLQMQSGTTIGSPPRIYSPIKQSLEKDPTGAFIRRWLPELSDLGAEVIHQPASSPRHGYPAAVIPPDKLWETMRANAPKSIRSEGAAVKRPSKNSPKKPRRSLAQKKEKNQLEFHLDPA